VTAPKTEPRTFHKQAAEDGQVMCGSKDVRRNEIRGAWDDVTCRDCLEVGRELSYWKGPSE
jgi:hypothetical protein